jgi:hypothetical protein
MRVPRRSFLHMVGAAIALGGSPQAARAQAYPSRPVHLIVGFPGQWPDRHPGTFARPIAVRAGSSKCSVGSTAIF